MILCGAIFVSGMWLGGGICAANATSNFVIASNGCEDDFDRCAAKCRGW